VKDVLELEEEERRSVGCAAAVNGARAAV